MAPGEVRAEPLYLPRPLRIPGWAGCDRLTAEGRERSVAWVGFAVGICVLAFTWSSVVKTLLVHGNARSLITTLAARGVLVSFRWAAAPIADMRRRERVLAAGPPVFLVVLLGCWVVSLYAAYALILLPFADGPATALRMSGSSLFTLGFATPDAAVPYGIVFVAAVSGVAVTALMIGYMPTINEDPHPTDPLELTREDFDAAARRLLDAGWTFERPPDQAWPHFRGWRVNDESAAINIAAHLDLPPAVWSGARARLGASAAMPQRPVHREPESP